MSSTPSLAAITLDARGGGIAAVSRLLWRVLQDEWGPACSLITLVPPTATSFDTAALERLVFGARLGWTQMARRSAWTLYSHLALARAQTFLPERLRRPYAVFLHGIEAWCELSPEQARILQNAAVLLVNSRYTATRIRSVNPWMPPLTVCPLALESIPEVRPERRGASPWGPEAVLVVGRMASAERYKGHDELLAAWPLVVRARPAATLVCVGEGDDRARLEAKARALGVAGSVVMTGFLTDEERDRAYLDSAVFAMPSRNEGFGLVYLEAMARGVPCVGSRFDAAREVIDDGVTGCLVDQDDQADLANRIISLLENEPLRRAMGQRGRERVLGQFGYEQFRACVQSALHGALGAHGLPAPAVSSAR